MPTLNVKNKTLQKAHRLGLFKAPKIVRRFKEDDEGVTAIEFGMLAFPFFMLLMAIIETSIFFFAGQVLESAVDDVGRMVRTGQMANTTTIEEFKTELCDRTGILFNCNDILVDMRTVAKYEDLGNMPGPKDGELDPADFGFAPAGAEQIVMVTAVTEWPIYTNYLQSYLSNLTSGNALITAVAVFKTEPFN